MTDESLYFSSTDDDRELTVCSYDDVIWASIYHVPAVSTRYEVRLNPDEALTLALGLLVQLHRMGHIPLTMRLAP